MKAIALVIAFLSLAASAQAACPPPPVGKPSDSVVQFVTSGTAGFGPTSALDATRAGSVVFDSSASTLKFCDGTGWVAVSMGVPSGAVWAFDLASCPAGWTEYTAARGRFLRGIDNGAGNDPDGTRAPSNVQTDDLKAHVHSVDPPSTATNSAGAHSHDYNRPNIVASYRNNLESGSNGNQSVTAGASTSSDGAHTHTVNIAAFDSASTGGTETRPKNVAVLFCRKT